MKTANITISAFLSFFLIFSLTAEPASAQIEIDADGSVGIGVSPDGARKLWVRCRNATDCSGTVRYGIEARVDDASSSAFGVNGTAIDGSATTNYGVRGQAANASGDNWAGYFSGDVFSTGQYQGSDERFKQEIQTLDGQEMLERVLLLQPRSYRYLNENELRNAGMPVFGSRDGTHLGIVAQELEGVFPELVIDKLTYLNDDGIITEETEIIETKAVNYNGLNIALLSAIQEQQAQIDEQRAQIEDLEARVEALENQ